MKRLFLLIGILLATLGCVRELPLPDSDFDPMENEGKVKIYFTLPVAGGMPSTKVLDEGNYLNDADHPGGLKTLHVAVFGSSGYLKEYVKADILGTGGEYHYQDAYKQTQSVTLINFSVTLSLSPKPRFVHLIGNSTEESLSYTDTTTIFSLLSGEGQPAYWQTIDLPNGINAEVVTDEVSGNQYYRKSTDGKTYVPDTETQNAFLRLFLIRNWAKLVMEVDDGAQFELKKFALINFPRKGTVAASITKDNGTRYFVRDYEGQDDQKLTAMGYGGTLPEETALFNTTVPTHAQFTGSEPSPIPIYNYDDVTKVSDPAYIYERPVPDKIPTFVIVYGTYRGGAEPQECYYKIDLSDDSSGDDKYYPIFRNFQYKIQIHKIESPGFNTPKDAAESPGSISVSANTTISGFSDISDGTARLAVQPWMAQSYNKAGYEDQLFVKFFSDVSQGVNIASDGSNDASATSNPVTFELIPRGEGLPNIITILPNGDNQEAFYRPDLSSDNYGWRKLRFKTADELPNEKITQTIRVKGVYTNTVGADKTLYRDIQITLLPSQRMYVWCTKTDLTAQSPITPPDDFSAPITLNGVSGEPLYLNMALPKDLPQSMFPLEILIEPEDMTLTPNVSSGTDLPVVFRETISDRQTESHINSFQYIRNLDWSEYLSAIAHDQTVNIESKEYALITSAFLTNRFESGTTIWVQNDYFYKTSTSFRNAHEFTDLSFQSYIPKKMNANVSVRFEVERDGETETYPTVTIVTRGMKINKIAGLSDAQYAGGQAVYTFTPSKDVTDFTCPTQVDDGGVSVSVQCNGYHNDQALFIQSHHFRIFGFLDGIKAESINKQSFVVYGQIIHDANVNRAAPFGYYHEPGYPASVKALNLSNNNRYESLDYKYNSTTLAISSVKNFPNGVDPTYNEIGFQTLKNKPDNYSFRLVADGYVEETVTATRFTGTIGNDSGSAITKSNVLKSGNNYNFGKDGGNWNFSYLDTTYVSFVKPDGSAFGFNNNGFKMTPQSGTTQDFTMNVSSTVDGHHVYFVDITFNKDPNELSVAEGAQIERCPNSKSAYRYLWTTPQNLANPTAPTALTIKTDHEITITQIIIKTVKYDTAP